MADSRVIADICRRKAQNPREDGEVGFLEHHDLMRQRRGERADRLRIGRTAMHHDRETRQEMRELLQHGDEACRRPELASAAGAGMDDQKPSAVVPAEALESEPTFGDEPLPGCNRRAQHSIRGCADRAQEMPPHLSTVGADRRGDHRSGYEGREPPGEAELAGAEPRHQMSGLTKIGRAAYGPLGLTAGTVRLLEQRGEPERVEVDGPIDDPERGEETADPRLRRECQPLVGPAPARRAERRNRQEDVAERAGMDDERQRRSSASAASWRRPFVASAVPV